MVAFRGGQLMVAAGQVADLTDEEIAAHPELVFIDVPDAPSGGAGGQGLGINWLEVAGHSLAGGGGARIVPHAGYAYLLQHALGIPNIHDYAIGGAISCRPAGAGNDGGTPWVLRNLYRPGQQFVTAAPAAPYSPQSQLVLLHFGLNDMGQLGAGKPLPWQIAMRTMLAGFCTTAWFGANADLAGAVGVGWAFTGAWSSLGITDTQASTSDPKGVRYTQTINDLATWTVPADVPGGRVFNLRLWLNATPLVNTYGVRVRRNGVWTALTDLTIDTAAMTDQTIVNMHQLHTVRFGSGVSGDPYGAINLVAGDAIEITLKATTGAGSLAIDGVGVESDPLDGPIFICPLPNKPANYGIWTNWPGFASMSDAAIDQWKVYERDILKEFPGRIISDSHGLGIDIDDAGVNRYTMTPGTSPPPAGTMPDFLNDGAHPNDHGHGMWAAHIAQFVRSSPLITDRIRARPFVDPRGRAWKQVGKLSTAGTYTAGWSAYGAVGIYDLQWRIDDRRRVYVRGAAKATTGATTTVLANGTLPKPAGLVDGLMTLYNGTTFAVGVVRISNLGTLQFVGPAVSTAAGNLVEFGFDYQAEI